MPRVEDFIAFNDEIVALVRLGIPLQLGLVQLGRDADTGLAKINAAVAHRISQGRSLTAALEAERDHFPPLYCHVVRAGLRAGRLPAALESLTHYVPLTAQMRQRLGRDMVYPLTICVLAYALFVWLVFQFAPNLEQTYDTFRIPAGIGLAWLRALGHISPLWFALPPLLLAGILCLRNLASRRSPWRALAWWQSFAWVPGVATIGRDYRCANVAELLALLLENNVPLEQSLQLAADAAGDKPLRSAAHAVAAAVREGRKPSDCMRELANLPPLLRWSVGRETDQEGLVRTMRAAGQAYRRVAARRSERLHTVFPLVACALIGGGVTLCYALMLIIPILEMLTELAVA